MPLYDDKAVVSLLAIAHENPKPSNGSFAMSNPIFN